MTNRIDFAFGTNLRNLRKSKGFSQDHFARTLGTNQANVTAWERGTRMPPLRKIMQIANIYQIPLSSLISVGLTGYDEDCWYEIAELLQSNSKFRTMFDRAKLLKQDDLDLVVAFIERLTNNDDENDVDWRSKSILK